MQKKSKDVIFRRVRGRVIPIRLTNKGKDYAKGSGSIMAALGTTVLGGYAAAKSVQASASLRHTAKAYYRVAKNRPIQRDMFKSDKWFTGKIGKKLLKNPLQSARYIKYASTKAFGLRNPIIAAATLAGTALLSAGAERLHKAKTGKNFNMPEQVGADLFSIAIAGVTAAAYYKFIPTGKKLKFGKILKKASRRSRGLTNPPDIPIKHKQGTLRFD